MTTTLRRTAIATAACLTIAAAGCSGDTPPTVPLTNTATAAFDGPDTRASHQTPEEQAKQQALAKVNDYYAVWAQVDDDPAVPIDQLGTVAGGPVLDGLRADIMLRRSQNVLGGGAIKVVTAEVTEAEVPVANGEAWPGAAWVKIRACTDISGMTWTHPDGTPAVRSDAPPLIIQTFTVRNATWPDPNGWRVTSQSTPDFIPCAA